MKSRIITTYIPAALFVAVSIALFFWREPVMHLTTFVEGNTLVSYVTFVLLLASATVFMPVTVLPAIPMMAPVFGPFVTGVLSIVGWTLGAVGAFLIARHLGRPVLGAFTPLEKLDRMAARVPDRAHFFVVVLLRMTFPVDIMSYVIGIVSPIKLIPYTIATIIGVSWFSFAFAYLGNAIFMGDMLTVQVFAAISVVVFLAGWYTLFRLNTSEKQDVRR